MVGGLAWLLSYASFHQDCSFLQPRPANDRFRAVDVRRNPAFLSSVLFALPISSPCLDNANEEIDPRATGSPGCWSLHLCRMNQMWVWESSNTVDDPKC